MAMLFPHLSQRSMHLVNDRGSSAFKRSLHWNTYEGQTQAFSQYLIYREDLAVRTLQFDRLSALLSNLVY
jgi:hypothetical protein